MAHIFSCRQARKDSRLSKRIPPTEAKGKMRSPESIAILPRFGKRPGFHPYAEKTGEHRAKDRSGTSSCHNCIDGNVTSDRSLCTAND